MKNKLNQIKCDSCEESVDIVRISRLFENFTVGQVECDNGHKQKRYLSESDILMYFAVSALIYAVAYLFIIQIINVVGFNLPAGAILAVIFIALYFLLKYACKYIYEKAPFKQEMKNTAFDEDPRRVSTNLKWQFIMFMLVTFMIGYRPDLLHYMIFLLFAFVILTFIRLRAVLNRERENYNKIRENKRD